ncbi:MAG: FMN-binding protein, partial [Lachnospiraceae bacterium]|nr:FMN-binding protein [Lachnospiraceae bacterium]
MAKKSISRRDFIKGMAATAASIAAFGVAGRLENASDARALAAEALSYTPGTYSAVAKGIGSIVTVTMTFDETSITDVQIDVSGETAGIGADIGDTMAQAILDSQTCDVDAVSGATVTSDAVKLAAANCISQAAGVSVSVSEDEEAAAD